MVEAIIPAGADEPSSSVIPAVPKPDRRSVGTPPSDGKRRAEPVPLSVMNDEPFRQSRVRELIAQAAAAPKPEPATAEKPAPPSKEPGTAAANER